jgi:hypothetical protein
MSQDPKQIYAEVVTVWQDECCLCGGHQLTPIGRMGYFRALDGAQVCALCEERERAFASADQAA